VASASGPTIIPGVSTSDTTGKPYASQSCRNRAALDASEGREQLRGEVRPEDGEAVDVAQRLGDRQDVVRRALALGHQVAQRLLRGRAPAVDRAEEVAQEGPGRVRDVVVIDRDVDHADLRHRAQRPDVRGRHLAQAAAGDHRRAAHAE
jgi:hypothetical protein